MREALQLIANATKHNGKSGNEYRYPSQIRINELAMEALSYEPDDVTS